MSAAKVYQQVRQILGMHIKAGVDESSFERICLLVTGIIGSQSESPSQIANRLAQFGLTSGKAESIERRIRRIENDPEIESTLCLHPLARWRLRFGAPRRLHLIIDATTQKDHLVMLTVAVWYRGRSLPLAWLLWPANTSLEDFDFWERVATLLNEVVTLLPENVPIIWLADRAFGSPAFIDLVTKGWHYVVRVQGQTRYQDRIGYETPIASVVQEVGLRAKGRGLVFKKRGWRLASFVAYWGYRHQTPLCLVSDLPPDWILLAWYRLRYAIEATFRDYKSRGWHWEQGQVRDLEHCNRLLVGMALATWITLMVGTQVAHLLLQSKLSSKRRTRPISAKFSLFSLGLNQLLAWFSGMARPSFLACLLIGMPQTGVPKSVLYKPELLSLAKLCFLDS